MRCRGALGGRELAGTTGSPVTVPWAVGADLRKGSGQGWDWVGSAASRDRGDRGGRPRLPAPPVSRVLPACAPARTPP